MNRGRVLFAGLYFALLLLATAPASLLNTIATQLSQQKLSLANCHGTLWHGGATPVLQLNPEHPLVLHPFNWEIHPASLLHGQLELVLNWDQFRDHPPIKLELTRQQIRTQQLYLPLPAAAISELSPFLKPAQFTGQLVLESPLLTFSNHQLLGNASAHWSEAGSALSNINPLGNYQLDIQARPNNIQATLGTKNGALILDGQGNWEAENGFHFNGTARARDQEQLMLSELLHHLGPEEVNGVYRITF